MKRVESTLEKAKAEYNAWKKVGENSNDINLKFRQV